PGDGAAGVLRRRAAGVDAELPDLRRRLRRRRVLVVVLRLHQAGRRGRAHVPRRGAGGWARAGDPGSAVTAARLPGKIKGYLVQRAARFPSTVRFGYG